MPQLAPINWLFLFMMFWTTVILSSAMLWWAYKVKFSPKTKSATTSLKNSTKSWRW
uniref:ATP synthase F0 subunit 8 n=1 Tax=Entemnotrochus adansonianus TaxID=121186 RepID=UPI001E79118B|nr:ATP synthase F0 subunit 8 [Entemnotrochus adansonianus]UDL72148.1 ATP synthase F0 subunit 8 [Entemnotrochus adansonianus]